MAAAYSFDAAMDLAANGVFRQYHGGECQNHILHRGCPATQT